jgi:hypothetical protein
VFDRNNIETIITKYIVVWEQQYCNKNNQIYYCVWQQQY